MKHIKLLLIALFFGSVNFCLGQEIVSYSSLLNPACSGVVYSDANLSAVGVCRGPGIVENTGGTYNSNSWTLGAIIDPTDYLEWTLTPNIGFELNLTTMDIRYDRSANGPTMVDLQVDTGSGFTSIFTDAAVNVNGENNNGIDLTAYTAITSSITFRLYAFNATTNAGTFDIEERTIPDKGVIINGTVEAICLSTVTWNGAWIPTVPDATTSVIIDANYDTGTNGNFTSCSLIINPGNIITVNNNSFISIQNDLIVDGNAVINVNSQGSVLQNTTSGSTIITDPTPGTGGIVSVTKLSAPINAWYEYTYWSSPVSGETIGDTFFGTNADRRYLFNGANYKDSFAEMNNDNDTTTPGQDDIDDNADDWQLTSASDIMQPGIGYAATLSPASFVFAGVGYAHIFEGPFNNGNFDIPVYRNDAEMADSNWNFIGNPYPSAIDLTPFFTENVYDVATNPTGTIDGALYLWSQNTPPSDTNNGNSALNFDASDYATINNVGGVAAGGDSFIPNGFIASGQGFFTSFHNTGDVISSSINGDGDLISVGAVSFTNSMRVSANNDQFFKQSGLVNDNKLWLNLSSDNGVFSQILIGYMVTATNADDGAFYDAKRLTASGIAAYLYSIIPGTDKKFAIQGKSSSSLTTQEVIPLGVYTDIDVPTLYSISIAQLEGDFFTGNPVYLRDHLMNTLHELSNSDYHFTSPTGDFNARFELLFDANSLVVPTETITPDAVSIIELENDNVLFTVPAHHGIQTIKIYDIAGRLIYQKEGSGIDNETILLSNLDKSIYLAQIELNNGQIINKKAYKK